MKRLLGITLTLLCLAFGANAAATPDLRDVDATLAAFKSAQRTDYEALDARYVAAIAAAPKDVELAVAHCRFLGNFSAVTAASWSKSAEDRKELCTDEVQRRWPNAKEVQVYLVEIDHSDDITSQAEKLWDKSDDWPEALTVRLATRLHKLYEDSDKDKANYYAFQAASRGNSDLVATAIEYLDSDDRRAEALKLVRESKPASNRDDADDRVDALLDMGEVKAARQDLERSIAADVDLWAYTEVKVYLADKDLAAANKAGMKLGDGGNANNARFDLALANGDMAKARDMVPAASKIGTQIKRYSRVAGEQPLSALSLPLLSLTLSMAIIVYLVAAGLGMLLLPVHYAGLALRLRHRTPKPMFEGIGLRHAWIALCILCLVPPLAAVAIDPGNIPAQTSGGRIVSAPFFTALVSSLAMLVTLLPWMPRLRMPPVAGRSVISMRTLVVVVACWGVIRASGMLSHSVYEAMFGDSGYTAHARNVSTMVEDGWATYGPLATLLRMAILTPIVEETIYRGMLLGGMSRHIGFGWANALQALYFAYGHDNPPALLFYLALGLLTGWLAHRYRSLLPAIALHALVNGYATLANQFG